jgi:HSP20 family protein
MQREINRMFDSFFRGTSQEDSGLDAASWTPAVDVAEQDSAFVVKMELPGVGKDDVKITMQENTLTVRGEKKKEKESKGTGIHRVERSYGAFQRSFTLPSSVKADKIDASYKDGILSILLPKEEGAKPRLIDVKVK